MVSSDPRFLTSDLESILAGRLQVFFGASDPAQARIYAQLELPESLLAHQADLRLSGRLIGPDCEFAHTLPARIPIVHRDGSQARLLAEAIVPDPCFWNPELPFLYRAEIQLHQGDRLLASWQRTLGIRRLGPRGRCLFFDGKRFVLRGIFGDLTDASTNPEPAIGDQADFLRQTWTALVVPKPKAELCQFAARRGVLLVADMRKTAANDATSRNEFIRELAQSPAVAIAILPNDQFVAPNRNDFRNLLLAQFVSATEVLAVASWADLVFVEVDDAVQFGQKTVGCNLPIVAVRGAANSSSHERSRAACDQLQSDLANIGDFAGYVT
jgi:Glycosyl hydrolases family 2